MPNNARIIDEIVTDQLVNLFDPTLDPVKIRNVLTLSLDFVPLQSALSGRREFERVVRSVFDNLVSLRQQIEGFQESAVTDEETDFIAQMAWSLHIQFSFLNVPPFAEPEV